MPAKEPNLITHKFCLDPMHSSIRVGIDFGNTIGVINNDEPFSHAFEMILLKAKTLIRGLSQDEEGNKDIEGQVSNPDNKNGAATENTCLLMSSNNNELKKEGKVAKENVVTITTATQTEDITGLLKCHMSNSSKSTLSSIARPKPTVLKHKVVFYHNRFIPIQSVPPFNASIKSTDRSSLDTMRNSITTKDRESESRTGVHDEDHIESTIHRVDSTSIPEDEPLIQLEDQDIDIATHTKTTDKHNKDVNETVPKPKDREKVNRAHNETNQRPPKVGSRLSRDKSLEPEIGNKTRPDMDKPETDEPDVDKLKHRKRHRKRKRHRSVQTDIHFDPSDLNPLIETETPLEIPTPNNHISSENETETKTKSSFKNSAKWEKVDGVFNKIVDVLQDDRGEPYKEIKKPIRGRRARQHGPLAAAKRILNLVFIGVGIVLFAAVILVIVISMSVW